MIEIKYLNRTHIGDWVRYTPSAGEPEIGRIKSWNDNYIFVVYRASALLDNWQDFTAASTKPEDLERI